MSPPTGKALVRIVQASLKEHQVTVSYGPDILARQLAFGVATSYATVSPGVQTVQFTASGAHTAMPVQLAADTVHTIVVLDDPSGLKIDALMDAAGSQIMPKGGTSTGLGGMASSPAADPAPWLLRWRPVRCWPGGLRAPFPPRRSRGPQIVRPATPCRREASIFCTRNIPTPGSWPASITPWS